MKSLIRTIIVIVVFGLVTGCFALAKDRTERESREVERTVEEYDRQQQELNRARQREELLREIRVKQEELQKQKALVLATRSQPGGERVLVIPAAEIKAEELLTITEDMSVMLHIFDEKLGQASRFPALLGNITFLTRDGRGTRGIYLDGYGALFVMKVDFPLLPPAEAAEEEKPKEGVDPVWQDAKRKIFEPEKGERYFGRRRVSRTRPEEKYDAEKIKELKRKLIRTLKHAANIRNLEPDEQVILSVTGRAESGRVTTKVEVLPGGGREILVLGTNKKIKEARVYNDPAEAEAALLAGQMGLYSPTVMTIRAKKADVDAFAKGELDFDKFRRKVQIFTY